MTYVEERARFIKLSWDLLAYKLYYYYPEKVHPSWHKKLDIPDSEYDELEREYLKLCLSLGEKNTVATKVLLGDTFIGPGMIELDFERPSVQQALKKHSKRRRHGR